MKISSDIVSRRLACSATRVDARLIEEWDDSLQEEEEERMWKNGVKEKKVEARGKGEKTGAME